MLGLIKTGSPETTGHVTEGFAQPSLKISNGERALFALSNDASTADLPCPGVEEFDQPAEFVKPAPTAAELAKRAARPAMRLKECEKLWRREPRCIDDEGKSCTWEELRPKLDVDYQSSVNEAMEELNSVRGAHVILYGDHECPDGVLANLLRAWYHLPEEHNVLLFVNDEAKYAYFIFNMHPYMDGGELLGWEPEPWVEEMRRRESSRQRAEIPPTRWDKATSESEDAQ